VACTKVGRQLCAAVRDLGVHLGTADIGRWVAVDLWGTSAISPN
jgi:hypothetical protein